MATTARTPILSPLTARRFNPAIQGLRGLAVLPVMGFHLTTDFPKLKSIFDYGWIGVDLFFVISGYLITGILLDSLHLPKTIYFKNFYIRRIIKIWPLYYALLLLMFGLVPLMRHSEGMFIFTKSHPWQSYLFFAQNFFVKGLGAGPLGLTWSLAIEEQFYLVWPLLVFTVPRKFLGYVLGVFIVFTVLLRAALLHRGWAPLDLYVNPFCRLDGLSFGALLAVFQRSNFYSSRLIRIFIGVSAGVGLAGLIIFGLSHPITSYLFLSLAFVSAVTFASVHSNSRILSWSPLAYIGTISYGLYLLHVVAYDVLRSTHVGQLGWVSAAIMVTASIILASGSWYCFEKPILGLKRYFPD